MRILRQTGDLFLWSFSLHVQAADHRCVREHLPHVCREHFGRSLKFISRPALQCRVVTARRFGVPIALSQLGKPYPCESVDFDVRGRSTCVNRDVSDFDDVLGSPWKPGLSRSSRLVVVPADAIEGSRCADWTRF